MKLHEIEVGRVYAVKVSGRLAPVRIDRDRGLSADTARRFGGTNLRTGRSVYLSAARCRYELEQTFRRLHLDGTVERSSEWFEGSVRVWVAARLERDRRAFDRARRTA